MNLRYIPYEEHTAFMNMAIDESVLEHVRQGKSPPTLRLYGWKPTAITIGFYQGVRYEVDREKCKSGNIDVTRRITGGGAVLHEHEITYSIIAPESEFPKNVVQSYGVICGYIVNALQSLGIHAVFHPINDIIVDEKKISGSAQTREKGILLQHGTLLLDVDVDKMFSLLIVPDEKIKDKLIQSVKKRVVGLKEFGHFSREQILKAILAAFQKHYQITLGEYLDEERMRAMELEKKYKSEEWVMQR